MTFERIVSLSEYHRLPQEALPADFYKRQLEVVCNNATLALFIMDEHQQCVYMNPAAETLTGYSLSETKGRALHNVIHHTRPNGSPYPLCECPIDRAFPQNNREQGEEVFVHKDGHFYPVAYTASPIREGDKIIGTIVEVRDITQEKLDEQARQELDRAKTEFFSNVSHEFRTPLTLMLASVEDALVDGEDPLSPRQRERLEVLQRNGARLLKLVNTLLDFSRVEANRIHAVYQPTDLAQLTTDLASLFQSAIATAGLSLTIDCQTLPEPVYVDREMWEKIVLNLISNAFKFTFAGEIAVRLRSIDSRVQLRIEDTGVGIPEAELPRVFQRFHRVSGTRSRSYEGSGIGLALVQELVKLHGGTIEVSSQIDRGTTFIVNIPFGREHLPANYLHAPADHSAIDRTHQSSDIRATAFVQEALNWLLEETPNPLLDEIDPTAMPRQAAQPSARILVVDDRADLRNYLKRLLSHQYQVETVNDGLAALAAIRQSPPDLVLSDVMMPEMDGFQLLRSLRSQPQTQNIPLILLSARAGEEAQIEGLAAGADDYLIKPFSARELLARVGATLKLAQLRRDTMQKEQALRLEAETAKQQVETILSSINDGFYVLDRDWCFTYVSDRYCEMVGMQRWALLGHNIWELFPDAVDTDAYVQFHRVMTEQTPLQFDYLYTPWDCWHHHRIYPSPSGLTVFLTDITERKIAEAELRQKNAILDAINKSAPTPIFVKDRQGRIIYANPATLEVLGKPASEVIGFRDGDLYPNPEDAARVMENDRRIMETGETEVVEESPDGIRTFLAMKSPYRNEAGEIIGLIGISNDISERVQLERDRERTLQQEQAAREAAEAANRIKDEFLAVLSHELRSPLNPILGWSKLLQNGKLDRARTKQALATIERNAKLQAQLIEDLLDVSRILRGKLPLNWEIVDLATTITSALDTVVLAAEAKSIQIELSLNPSVGQVRGDGNRLQQVVWNLLSNAIKFTPSGGRVEILLTRAEGSTGAQMYTHTATDLNYAQIQVSDTGKGISADFLPYIFEYFRQADSSMTRAYGGLGLGLAIARQLVELHGGTIWAESQGEGRGATFTVQLPVYEGSREQEIVTSYQLPVTVTPDARHPTPLSGLQILIVDDDADTREFLVFTLQQYGARVAVAGSVTEAIAAVLQSQPDVLLSDLGMPDIDGYALIRQLRAMPLATGRQIPAIAFTSYTAETTQKQVLAAGYHKYIAKPAEPMELVTAIVELVRAETQEKMRDEG